MEATLIAIICTSFVFGAVGYRASHRVSRPVKIGIWIILGVAAIFGWLIGIGIILVGIGDFRIYLNVILESLALGILAGIVEREINLRSVKPAGNGL